MGRERLAMAAIAALAVWMFASAAIAAERVRLNVGFTPNRPGSATTVLVGFHIDTTTGVLPSPLTKVEVRLPRGMSLSTTTLGEVVCRPKEAIGKGGEGCPRDSVMGHGHALVAVPLGGVILSESVAITLAMGPPISNHTAVLFEADGMSPVAAEVFFEGELIEDSGIFGARLNTNVPIVPTVPDGPDAVVVSMKSSMGPLGVTYFRRSGHHLVKYHPIGMRIPASCPAGGFPFAAVFSFLDGSRVTTRKAVPCPQHGKRMGSPRG